MNTIQKDSPMGIVAEATGATGFLQQLIGRIDPWLILEKAISLLVIALLTVVVLKIATHIIDRVFDKKKTDVDSSQMRRTVTLNNSTKTFIRSLILLAAVLIALSLFIDVGAIVAVAGVGTLAIGLGAKGLVEDLMAGFVIILENYFDVGDYVTIESQYGMIESIGIRTTTIRKTTGELFIIQNGQIDRVLNHSKGAILGTVRIDVSYDENLVQVFQILDHLMPRLYEERPELFMELPEVFGVSDTKPSSLEISIYAQCTAALKIRCEAYIRKRILETFVEENIAFPYEVITLQEPDKEGNKGNAHGQ
ncbi:MAG: mechanosensitive ion channel [Eubacteriaceae bacterium]|nr:mechanosensitive ion channel [Eubacteriaceae bacterium]